MCNLHLHFSSSAATRQAGAKGNLQSIYIICMSAMAMVQWMRCAALIELEAQLAGCISARREEKVTP
jgi:hypothetical protein